MCQKKLVHVIKIFHKTIYLARLYIYEEECVYWVVEAHCTQLFLPDDAIVTGSDIFKAEEEHWNIKIVCNNNSVCNNAYTSIRNGKIWYETNILEILPRSMVTFKKLFQECCNDWSLNRVIVVMIANQLRFDDIYLT